MYAGCGKINVTCHTYEHATKWLKFTDMRICTLVPLININKQGDGCIKIMFYM